MLIEHRISYIKQIICVHWSGLVKAKKSVRKSKWWFAWVEACRFVWIGILKNIFAELYVLNIGYRVGCWKNAQRVFYQEFHILDEYDLLTKEHLWVHPSSCWLHLGVYPSIRLSICRSVHSSTDLSSASPYPFCYWSNCHYMGPTIRLRSVHLSLGQSVHLLVHVHRYVLCPSAGLSGLPRVRQFIRESDHLSVGPFVCTRVCQSMCRSTRLTVAASISSSIV